MIAHSNSEFVIDFIRLMPGVPKAKVKSRIVITPEHAKRFLLALKDNIEKYENSFGPIKRTEDMPKFPMNFGGTVGEAYRTKAKRLNIKGFSSLAQRGCKILGKGFACFILYDTFAVLIFERFIK